jgi:hypothetical protein
MSTEDQRAAIVCSHISRRTHPILRAVRDEPEIDEDSGWQFLCCSGEEEDSDKAQVWLVSEVVEFDPTLKTIIGLKPGTVAMRKAANEPWEISSE